MKRKLKTTYSMTEARADWYKLVDRVSKGERITLTRYGVPVAKIEPAKRSVSAVIDEFLDYRNILKRVNGERKRGDKGGEYLSCA